MRNKMNSSLKVLSLILVLTLFSLASVSAFDTYINNSNIFVNGSVGIGTDSPTNLLHVLGNIFSNSTITGNSFSGAGTGLTGTASSLTCGVAQTGDSASGFFSTGIIEDDRLSFSLADAVSDGGCTDCITDSMVSNTLTSSDLACTDCVSSGEVQFNYASSSSEGGAADDLACTDCVDGSDLADSITLDSNLDIDSGTLYVDQSNNRIGIGTSSPGNLLHIYDSIPSADEVLLNVSTNSGERFVVDEDGDVEIGGNLGIGVEPNSSKVLYVNREDISVNGYQGIHVDIDSNSASGIIAGGYFNVNARDSAISNPNPVGLQAYAYADDSHGDAWGIDTAAYSYSSDSLASPIGLNSGSTCYLTSGSCKSYGGIFKSFSHGSGDQIGLQVETNSKQSDDGGSVYGIYVDDESADGSGNYYGLYLSGSGTHVSGEEYGVYQSSSNHDNYFAGNVGIGRSPATNKFEVEGDASKTSAGDWLANSDRRIKTDVQDINNALDTVSLLRPVKFKYTDEYKLNHDFVEDKYYYNFIAQEYAEIFPESVKGSGEFLEDGSEILQMDSYNAQIVAIKAIQELKEELDSKNDEIQMLKSELCNKDNSYSWC